MSASPHRFRQPSSTEAIYIRTGTQVVSRSAVTGDVSQPQFRQALTELEARFPILRAAVLSGHFVEKPGDAQTPLEWLPASVTVEALYERLFDTPLDLATTIYTVHVISRNGRFDVFMVSSHAVTDATSLVELHSALIYLCDCVLRGVAPALGEQPFPDSVDGAVARCLTMLGHAGMRASAPAEYSGPFLQLPMRPAAAAPPVLRHRLHRLVIEAAEMEAVIAAAHAHDVSLHCLLAAGFARAIQQLSHVASPRMLLRCSVDLRRRLEPHLSTDLVFSAITAHTTRIDDMSLSIFAIARVLHEDIQASTRDGRIFMDYESYPKAFGNPQDMPAALNISDMGRIAFHGAIERLRPTGFDYATSWGKPYPNVSVTIHEGQLVANTSYIAACIDRRVIEQMAAMVRQALRLCSERLVEA